MLEKCLASLERFDFDVTVVDNTKNGNEFREQAPWGLGLVPEPPYIVMDEDIEIDPGCPDDLAERLLWPSHFFLKIGLQIRTDDVPALPRYDHSLNWERSLNARPLREGLMDAEVDTHFALYWNSFNPGICGVRLAAPYQCRHLPWYHMVYTEEELDYYKRTGPEWARTHSAGELVEKDSG